MARDRAEAGKKIQVSHVHDRKLITSHHCYLPRSPLAGSRDQKPESGTKPKYSDVRQGHLSHRLNTAPPHLISKELSTGILCNNLENSPNQNMTAREIIEFTIEDQALQMFLLRMAVG